MDYTATTERDGWHIRRDCPELDWGQIMEVYQNDTYRLRDARMFGWVRTVLDVGACIGAFSRLAAEIYPEATIIAIEPAAENVEVCRRNVGKRVQVLRAAVTYESDPVFLDSLTDGARNVGASTVKAQSDIQDGFEDWFYALRDQPPFLTLEQVLEYAALESVDLLKLDCEGSEYSILERADLTRVRMIVGEYHGGYPRFADLIERRFPADQWWCRTWSAHDHMGSFWLERQDRERMLVLIDGAAVDPARCAVTFAGARPVLWCDGVQVHGPWRIDVSGASQ